VNETLSHSVLLAGCSDYQQFFPVIQYSNLAKQLLEMTSKTFTTVFKSVELSSKLEYLFLCLPGASSTHPWYNTTALWIMISRKA
jgi:hypothetical protein